MPRVITDSDEIRQALQRLEFHAEIPDKLLNEWLEGVKISRADRISGPMVRLRVYSPGETVMKEGGDSVVVRTTSETEIVGSAS